MQPDLKSILKTIFDDDETGHLLWQPYLNELYAYIDAELAGEDAASIFPMIKQYLDESSEFRQDYEELKELLLSEQQGELELPIEPSFDFSYLEPPPYKPSIWKPVGVAGQQIMRLFTEIRIFVGQQRAFFGPLPSPLTPQLIEGWATRERATEAKGSAQVLSLASLEPDLSLSLKISSVSETKITFSIQLARTSSNKPLDKATVTLLDEARRMLESNLSRGNQEVIFRNVEAGSYLVEVKYQDQIWELPLIFAPEEETSNQENE